MRDCKRGSALEHGLATQTLAEQSASQLSWSATTIGMAFHSLLRGVALAAAVAAEAGGHSGLVGLGTALVIILHKPFDAMTVSTLMAASGCSRFSRHVLNGLFALATPLGAILFYAGASQFFGSNPAFLGGALAFCAGTFLCIACADLLPELQFHSHDRLKLSLALANGLAVAVLLGEFETSGHAHRHEPTVGVAQPARTVCISSQSIVFLRLVLFPMQSKRFSQENQALAQMRKAETQGELIATR